MTKGEEARNLFLDGHNCAQAVLCTYARDLGLSDEQAIACSACFGGGLGAQREVCGAVSAMCMVLSLKYAPKDPKDHEAKKEFYARIQEVCRRFKEVNGSIICRELLGLVPGTAAPSKPLLRTPQYYRQRPCPNKVKSAVDILEQYLSEQK